MFHPTGRLASQVLLRQCWYSQSDVWISNWISIWYYHFFLWFESCSNLLEGLPVDVVLRQCLVSHFQCTSTIFIVIYVFYIFCVSLFFKCNKTWIPEINFTSICLLYLPPLLQSLDVYECSANIFKWLANFGLLNSYW